MVKTINALGVDFELDDTGEGPFVVLGIRKSGSSILNSMCTALAEFNGVRYVDVGGTFFKAGQRERDWRDDTRLCDLLLPGNLLGGFRSYPAGFEASPLYASLPKVVMVRDPRDALVSEYFSNAYSHSLPEAGQARKELEAQRNIALSSDIGDYIQRQLGDFAETCRPFAALARDPMVKVFRYEDYIFEKPKLLAEICEHFGWKCTPQLISNIMKWADVRPSSERPTEFVRRVTPGDHKTKMPPETQERVKSEMAEFMEAFGYE